MCYLFNSCVNFGTSFCRSMVVLNYKCEHAQRFRAFTATTGARLCTSKTTLHATWMRKSIRICYEWFVEISYACVFFLLVCVRSVQLRITTSKTTKRRNQKWRKSDNDDDDNDSAQMMNTIVVWCACVCVCILLMSLRVSELMHVTHKRTRRELCCSVCAPQQRTYMNSIR